MIKYEKVDRFGNTINKNINKLEVGEKMKTAEKGIYKGITIAKDKKGYYDINNSNKKYNKPIDIVKDKKKK